MSLILRKGYEAVTVADICKLADAGRSTFYSHYESKDVLLRSGLNELRAILLDRQRASRADGLGRDRKLGFSLAVFEHARSHWDFHHALASGGPVVLEAVREILADLVRNELVAGMEMKTEGEIPRELAVQFVVGAYVAVVTWWMDGGAKLPAEQVDVMFQQLVSEGMKPFLVT